MLTSFIALVALTPALASGDRPVPPRDLSSVKAVQVYLREVRAWERERRELGLLTVEDQDWAEEQGEYFGMRGHLLMMRAGEDGVVDRGQMLRAVKHKREMRPLPGTDYIGTGWTFIGPRALDGTTSCQDGPVTGRVNGVCYNPSDPNDWWVAGATGGVFKTADGGATFVGESDTWDTTYSSDIAVDPTNGNRVYVATGDYPGWWGYGLGLMRTTNGTSWTNELVAELQGCEVSDILIDPDDPATVLVAAGRGTGDLDGCGVWRSTDYGNTWAKVLSSTSTNGYTKLSAGIRVNNVRHIYASLGDSGIVRKSEDGGANWASASVGVSSFVVVAASRTHRDAVYAYLATGDIHMSLDAGENWSSIRGNLGNITGSGSDFRQVGFNYLFDVINTASDGTGGDILVFGAVDCFAIINPIGGNRTWSWINGNPGDLRLVHADYHGFSQHPTLKNSALIGNDGGVWGLMYVAGLYTWVNKNSALRLTEHVFTAPHPDASTFPNTVNTGMWHLGCGWSPNNVNDWRSNYGGDGMWTSIDDQNPAIQYVSSQNLGAGGTIGLRGTTTSWTTTSNLSTTTSINPENWAFAGPWVEVPGDTGALYMAGERLYKLKWTGGAATWTKSIGGADFSVNSDEYATAIEAVSGGGCFVGTWRGRLFGSLNPTTGVPLIHDFSGSVSSVCASPTDSDDLLVSIGGVEAGGPNGSGALWEVLDATGANPAIVSRTGAGTNSLPGIGVNWIERDPYDPMFTWYAATDLGVFYTRDRGANWYNISESFGLPNALVYHLEASDNILYASTFGRGIWRMSLFSSAPTLSAFAFTGTEVTGGNRAPATMTLSREAPPGGLDVPVTSNNLAVIPTQLVHFPAGATSATVNVDTEIVTADVNVTVTANYGGPVSDSIIVRECKVVDLSLSNVTSGEGFNGTVTIDRPAPSGGLTVNMADNDPGTTVETPVTIVSGATTALFTVTTTMVPSDVLVGVQASGPGSGWQESFTKYGVRATNVLGIVAEMWNTLPGTVSVTLNRAAPTGGFKFILLSSNPNVVQVPATWTVPAGQFSQGFQFQTKYVPSDTNATIRLTDPYQGVWEVPVTVRHLGVQSLTFNPNPVVGGLPSTGTVTLDRNVGIIGFTVNLGSQFPAFVQVPPTMTVPANSASGTFQATTFGVAGATSVPVSAVVGADLVTGAFQTVDLQLLPNTVRVVPSSFLVNLGQVTAGNVASLASDDGDVLRVSKFIVPNQTVAPVTVQVDGSSPVTACSALRFEFRSRMQTTGVFGLTLDLFNWTANNWDAVNTLAASVNTSFSTHTLVASGTLSQFLRSSDGAVRARYRVRQNGPAAALLWCHETDRANWIVTP